MSRQKSLRSFLMICCSLALFLYIAALVFAHAQTQENQPPSTQENRTMHEPPATGTTGNQKSPTKGKKAKKSQQSKTNARQKPGPSTGTNQGMNQGTNPDTNNPDKTPR